MRVDHSPLTAPASLSLPQIVNCDSSSIISLGYAKCVPQKQGVVEIPPVSRLGIDLNSIITAIQSIELLVAKRGDELPT